MVTRKPFPFRDLQRDEQEQRVLNMIDSGVARSREMHASISHCHHADYRPLDRTLQRLRRRGVIMFAFGLWRRTE